MEAERVQERSGHKTLYCVIYERQQQGSEVRILPFSLCRSSNITTRQHVGSHTKFSREEDGSYCTRRRDSFQFLHGIFMTEFHAGGRQSVLQVL